MQPRNWREWHFVPQLEDSCATLKSYQHKLLSWIKCQTSDIRMGLLCSHSEAVDSWKVCWYKNTAFSLFVP
jgi:hypothetical protein